MGEDYSKLQRKLQDWIVGEKRTFKMTANLDAFFELIVDWDNGRHIIVGVYKDNPHRILVRMSWTMIEDHVKTLDAMQREQRESTSGTSDSRCHKEKIQFTWVIITIGDFGSAAKEWSISKTLTGQVSLKLYEESV